MNDFELLHNDHALLSSQVVHVVALVKALEQGTTSTASLFAELARQMELLQQQLREHFAFEEAQAFPQLRIARPDMAPALEPLHQQHAIILEAFEKLLTCVNSSEPDWNAAAVLSDTFKTAFSEHAALEAQLFGKISGAQR